MCTYYDAIKIPTAGEKMPDSVVLNWPCITNCGIPTYQLKALGRKSTLPMFLQEYNTFYLFQKKIETEMHRTESLVAIAPILKH